ncbi:MAG: deoxyribose-phosphate aldolase [Bacteroidota bacterium]
MRVAPFLDHTLLKANTTKSQIEALCQEAMAHEFHAVCVSPYYTELASRLLKSSKVKVAVVVGFPFGYAAVSTKVFEINRAIQKGADEIDAVINISAVKNEDWKYVRGEINSLTTAVNMRRKVLKLILETALLTEEEIVMLCQICTEEGVNFVKNATGLNGGATLATIQLLRQHLPNHIQIKASGGIRDANFALELLAAGATRIGTSSGVVIAKAQNDTVSSGNITSDE